MVDKPTKEGKPSGVDKPAKEGKPSAEKPTHEMHGKFDGFLKRDKK
jgi:hypothetical protein